MCDPLIQLGLLQVRESESKLNIVMVEKDTDFTRKVLAPFLLASIRGIR